MKRQRGHDPRTRVRAKAAKRAKATKATGKRQASTRHRPGKRVLLPPPTAAERAGVRNASGRWYAQRTTAQGFKRREGEIEVRPFAGPVCYVNLRYATTVGDPGSFSSDRVEVGLSMPAYPAEIADIYEDASAWVGQRLLQERDELLDLRKQRERVA